ncbi:MAG: tetratricopeptide repeat protein [Desulfovibrio sp.]|jgi:tetratricopeptide (TPR) repeat protein|nr:tetratricopeptide repeat protein [Desulfovibrio sp.]
MIRIHFPGAICLAIAALLLNASHPAQAAEPAPVLLHHGERFLRIGNLGFAKANYDKLIANYEGTPEAAEAHGDLGVIAARQGDDELAVAEYEKAIAGGFELAHFNLGQALLRQLDKGGDKALKDRARAEFLAFDAYLKSGKPRPPILAYSMPEVETELADALKRLQ